MTGQSSLRQKIQVALAACMAISLPGAIISGAIAIIQFGEPGGNTAAMIAQFFAWVFAAAFLGTFALAMVEWLSEPAAET
jgi:hypothetical protein